MINGCPQSVLNLSCIYFIYLWNVFFLQIVMSKKLDTCWVCWWMNMIWWWMLIRNLSLFNETISYWRIYYLKIYTYYRTRHYMESFVVKFCKILLFFLWCDIYFIHSRYFSKNKYILLNFNSCNNSKRIKHQTRILS